MEPKLVNVDLVGKSGTDMNVFWKTNGDWGCSLSGKIVRLTLFGGGPWLLC